MILLSIYLLLATLALQTQTLKDSKVPPGGKIEQVSVGGKSLFKKAVSQGEANQLCEDDGKRLAVFLTVGDAQKFVSDLAGASEKATNPDEATTQEATFELGLSRRYWIGLTDVIHEGQWVWMKDGTELTYEEMWTGGQPDHYKGGANKNEHCVVLWNPNFSTKTDDGKDPLHSFNDENCGNKHYFICEDIPADANKPPASAVGSSAQEGRGFGDIASDAVEEEEEEGENVPDGVTIGGGGKGMVQGGRGFGEVVSEVMSGEKGLVPEDGQAFGEVASDAVEGEEEEPQRENVAESKPFGQITADVEGEEAEEENEEVTEESSIRPTGSDAEVVEEEEAAPVEEPTAKTPGEPTKESEETAPAEESATAPEETATTPEETTKAPEESNATEENTQAPAAESDNENAIAQEPAPAEEKPEETTEAVEKAEAENAADGGTVKKRRRVMSTKKRTNAKLSKKSLRKEGLVPNKVKRAKQRQAASPGPVATTTPTTTTARTTTPEPEPQPLTIIPIGAPSPPATQAKAPSSKAKARSLAKAHVHSEKEGVAPIQRLSHGLKVLKTVQRKKATVVKRQAKPPPPPAAAPAPGAPPKPANATAKPPNATATAKPGNSTAKPGNATAGKPGNSTVKPGGNETSANSTSEFENGTSEESTTRNMGIIMFYNYSSPLDVWSPPETSHREVPPTPQHHHGNDTAPGGNGTAGAPKPKPGNGTAPAAGGPKGNSTAGPKGNSTAPGGGAKPANATGPPGHQPHKQLSRVGATLLHSKNSPPHPTSSHVDSKVVSKIIKKSAVGSPPRPKRLAIAIKKATASLSM